MAAVVVLSACGGLAGVDGDDGAGGGGGSSSTQGPGQTAGPVSVAVASSGSGGETDPCAEIGVACGPEQPCAANAVCLGAVCLPQYANICGGFAGAVCNEGTVCLHSLYSDFGYCLLPEQLECACAVPGTSDEFFCP